MDREDAWKIIVLIIFTLFAAQAVWGIYSTAVEDVYGVKKAKGWLDRAQVSNDLEKQAEYLNNSLAEIEHLSGNPVWFFPSARTDFTVIRENLKENRDIALETAKLDINNMSYQFAVQNLENSINEVKQDLDDTRFWLYFTGWALVSCIVFVVLFILMCAAFELWGLIYCVCFAAPVGFIVWLV